MSEDPIDMIPPDPSTSAIQENTQNPPLNDPESVPSSNNSAVARFTKRANHFIMAYALIICMIIYGFDVSPMWLLTLLIPYPIIWVIRGHISKTHRG